MGPKNLFAFFRDISEDPITYVDWHRQEFLVTLMGYENSKNNTGILLPKLFWPTARKKCSSDREKLLKFEAENLQTIWDR